MLPKFIGAKNVNLYTVLNGAQCLNQLSLARKRNSLEFCMKKWILCQVALIASLVTKDAVMR